MTNLPYADFSTMVLFLGRNESDLERLFGQGGRMIGRVGSDGKVHYLFTINMVNEGANVSLRLWKLESCRDCELPDICSSDFLKKLFDVLYPLDSQPVKPKAKCPNFVVLNPYLRKIDFYRLFGPAWNFCLVTNDSELGSDVPWRFCLNMPYLFAATGNDDTRERNSGLESLLSRTDPGQLMAFLGDEYPRMTFINDACLDETRPGQ